MKIVKHGNALSFYCLGCGCQWTANKQECKAQTKYNSCMPSGKEYYYNCPECGFRTVGSFIKADDINEPEKK